MSGASEFVLEIGCEELPSSAVYRALEQLAVSAPAALDAANLSYDSVRVFATPRRLVVSVSELAHTQSDSVHTFKGPAAAAAFDAAGNATPAAAGFARSKGIDVSDLTVVEDGSGAYVYATVAQAGRPAREVLPSLLSRLVEQLDWAKSQRWGSGTARFSRPVRWLLALHGTDIVAFEFASLTAGRTTYGHRFLAPGPVDIDSAADFMPALAERFVIVDQSERARLLHEGALASAGSVGGTPIMPERTLAEVVNLVEHPTVAVGSFDASFLEVPREMLEYAMTGHQRYFPVERVDGRLDNHFVVAHNGDPAHTDQIIAGHERVIRARLADAAFFYREDLTESLEKRVHQLSSVVFHVKLGTVFQKVERVEKLVARLCDVLDAPADTKAHALRAAHLCKADLVTNAVVEFTDLQGTMGRYYALAAGEAPEVALAIEQHYLPRFSGDVLPAALEGRVVSMADKLDTICGIFAAGLAPKGSADPFALRRSAIGVLQMILDGTRLTLDAVIGETLEGYRVQGVVFDVDAVGAAVKTFVLARLEGLLKDRGIDSETIAAVLPVAGDDPADALARCEALTGARAASAETFDDLSIAFKRAAKLVGDVRHAAEPSLMGDHERALADALAEAKTMAEQLMAAGAYSSLLEVFAGMRGAIDAFFDNVLVMDEDLALRNNRLGLLGDFVDLFQRFADFSRLAEQ